MFIHSCSYVITIGHYVFFLKNKFIARLQMNLFTIAAILVSLSQLNTGKENTDKKEEIVYNKKFTFSDNKKQENNNLEEFQFENTPTEWIKVKE